MAKIRIGMIGYGVIGAHHASYMIEPDFPGELVAICDSSEDRLKAAKELIGDKLSVFESPQAMYDADLIDAIFIATPHYFHPPLAIEAFKRGFHVLIEKPAGVYTKHVREMNDVAQKSGKVFGIMFNLRLMDIHKKLKDLIDTGELGEIKRTNWIATQWYRPQSYFDAGTWRATWKGEGGGVLLNQCPHQLDIWQWLCGMPKRVRAFCHFGKYHNIEVEDDVTAYVEYENGATGTFIASTGEAPGTNRLEIVGDRGKIVLENGQLTFWRLRESERKFNSEFTGGFGEPENWKCEIPSGTENSMTQHKKIMIDWINAIKNGADLLAPGAEGIKSLTLSNAMMLSTWMNDWVELPFDDDLFYKKLQEKIENSTFQKDHSKAKTMEAGKSFKA